MPTFCQKTSILSKNRALMSFFQKVFMINMPLSCPCSVKKHQFCQKYTILWASRVNRMPFFPIFLEKIAVLKPIFRQRNVNLLKITLPSYPNFVKKNVNFLKKTVLSCHFFQIGHKKSRAAMPVFDKKLSILLKLHQLMGQNRQQNALFFRFFTTKTALMLIFC